MKDTDISYIAGLIDGEGYIGIKKSTRKDCVNPVYQARIQIRMVDEQAIKFVTDNLGGNYYKESPGAAKGRPLYAFQASDQKAENILTAILPYLKVKYANAQTVLEYRQIQKSAERIVIGTFKVKHRSGKIIDMPRRAHSKQHIDQCERLYQTCKRLNKTGI